MNVYTNTTFTGVHPVGTAAVVVAQTKELAAALLNNELERMKLKGDVQPEDMERVTTFRPQVIILSNGDY